MVEKKLQRIDFLKYVAVSFSDAGFNLIDSLTKNIETKLHTGTWIKAISLAELESLPRLVFLNGYWLFVDKEGKSAFKALCPHDNSVLQHRLPDNNLFCIRCSSMYCPSTGNRLNPEKSDKSLCLKALPLKKTERGIFVFLGK